MKNSLQSALRSRIFIYCLFMLSVFLTVYTYSISILISKDKYLTEFKIEHEEITDIVKNKLLVYEKVLRSGVALFNSKESVSRAEWRAFSNIININKNWPGIQALGYALALTKHELSAHEELIRSEGFSNYAVQPESERNFYTSIIYIEPFDWRNQRAFGYDMWSNPIRKQAMEAAMLSGKSQASGAITLLQETASDTQQGFLIYTPVYKKSNTRNKNSTKTLNDMQGWVYAPFRMNDFMQSVVKGLSTDAKINITDEISLYQASNQESHQHQIFSQPSDTSIPYLTRSKQISVFGRQWSISLSVPEYSATKQLTIEKIALFVLNLLVNILFLIVLLKYRKSQLQEDHRFTERYKGLIAKLNEKSAHIDSITKENVILEKNIDTLQEWLQERELRINELKLNQKDVT